MCVSPAGSIIRCMRRLEEVLRQMCSAAKAIGNTELENKFAEGENIQNLSRLDRRRTINQTPGRRAAGLMRMRVGFVQMFPGPVLDSDPSQLPVT